MTAPERSNSVETRVLPETTGKNTFNRSTSLPATRVIHEPANRSTSPKAVIVDELKDPKLISWKMFLGLKDQGKIVNKQFGGTNYPYACITLEMTLWMKEYFNAPERRDLFNEPILEFSTKLLQKMVDSGYIARVVKSPFFISSASPKTTARKKSRTGVFKNSNHTYFSFDLSRIAPFVLNVIVQEGINVAEPTSKASPFVRLVLNGVLLGKTTYVPHETTNPKWGEKFSIGLPDTVNGELEVIVCDHHSKKSFLSTKSQELMKTSVRVGDMVSPERPMHDEPEGEIDGSISPTDLDDDQEEESKGIIKGFRKSAAKMTGLHKKHKRALHKVAWYDLESLTEGRLEQGAKIGLDLSIVKSEDAQVTPETSKLSEKHGKLHNWRLETMVLQCEDVHDSGLHVPTDIHGLANVANAVPIPMVSTSHDGVKAVIEMNDSDASSGPAQKGHKSGHHTWGTVSKEVGDETNDKHTEEQPNSILLGGEEVMVEGKANILTDSVKCIIKNNGRAVCFCVIPLRTLKTIRHQSQKKTENRKPRWFELYSESSGHTKRNGRIQLSILVRSMDKSRSIMELLTDIYIVTAIMAYLFILWIAGSWRTWVLYISCVPLFLYLPSIIGNAMTLILTAALKGFPLGMGALRLIPWIRDGALHLLINVENFTFSNPPNFPTKHFLEVDKVSIHLAIPFSIVGTAIKKFREVKWSPFPVECAKMTGYDAIHPKRPCTTPGEKLGTLIVEHIDITGVHLNFQLYKGLFNINGFSRLLAEGKAFGKGWPSTTQVPTLSRKMERRPNCLKINVVSARGLDPTVKSMDPKVTVILRHAQVKTKVIMRNHKPFWDETFLLPCDDPSAVLRVELHDEDITRSVFIGQWIMTMKFFKIRPDWNFHDEIDLSGKTGYQISGWFPLMDRGMLKHRQLGSVQMRMSWIYDPSCDPASDKYTNEFPPPRLTALEQLQQNSDETTLKAGNMSLIGNMLDNFPLLFNVKRVTIRDIHFFLEDLFRGFHGAEDLGVGAKAMVVQNIEVTKALIPEKGKDGITLWSFLFAFWIKGLAPIVAQNAKLIRQASTQIVGSAFDGMVSGIFRKRDDHSQVSSQGSSGAGILGSSMGLFIGEDSVISQARRHVSISENPVTKATRKPSSPKTYHDDFGMKEGEQEKDEPPQG